MEWKDIQEYEGFYQVNWYGLIKSVERTVVRKDGKIKTYKEKILRQHEHYKNGYLSVMLSKVGIQKRFMVHRLVAEAFIPNPDNFPEINHINGKKSNCWVENLEWVSHKQNSQHAAKIGLLKKRPVVAILPDGSREYEFDSTKEAERQTGVNITSISLCCNGKRKTAGGLIWKYA